MKSFVARGMILASSLMVGTTAMAQGPVYGTPTLLPPTNSSNNTSTYGPSGSAPRRLAAPSQVNAWPSSYRMPTGQAANSPSDAPGPQSSVLTEPIQPGNTAPNYSPAPQNYDYSPGQVGSGVGGYGNGYSNGNGNGGYSNGNGGYGGAGGCATGQGSGGGYGGGAGAGYDSVGCDMGGGGCGAGFGVSGSGWYAGVGSIYFTRDDENPYTFSYDTANEAQQLTDTRNAGMGWSGGFETWLGHYFNCGQNAIELGYWQLFPGQSTTTTTNANTVGNLNGILNWGSVTYNGQNGDQYVNNAQAHQVIRNWEIQNVELNFLQLVGCNGGYSGCSPLSWSLLAGVRYFRFDETMQFGADRIDTTFNGDVNELYYNINTDNNLIGFQLGGNGRYALTQNLSFTTGLKVGVYENYIDHRSVIYGSAGVATINNGPYAGRAWDISSNKNDVAFMSELNLGLNYQLGCRWSIYGGYRAIALTGVALPTNQIYPDLRGINDVEVIDSNGSLILHGAYAGATFCF